MPAVVAAGEQLAARAPAQSAGNSEAGSWGSRNGNRRQACTRWICWAAPRPGVSGRPARTRPGTCGKRPRPRPGSRPGRPHRAPPIAPNGPTNELVTVGEPQIVDDPGHLVLLGRVRGEPHARRRGAEPGPGQPGAQPVAQLPARLRDADQQHQPAAVPRRVGRAEAVDAGGAVGEQPAARLGQRPADPPPRPVGDEQPLRRGAGQRLAGRLGSTPSPPSTSRAPASRPARRAAGRTRRAP